MKMKTQVKSVNKFLAITTFVAMSGVLGGCASPSTSKGMTPDAIQTVNKHNKTASVAVGGGKETDAMGKSQIADAAFAQALTDSINSSKIFTKVVQGAGADYLLTVTVFNIDQPSFGMSFTVKMETAWTLKKVATGEVVWKEMIKSEHTATVSDAFVGAERLRLANEGAAKNNIAQGLAKISALKL
jgi:hypothetical protein